MNNSDFVNKKVMKKCYVRRNSYKNKESDFAVLGVATPAESSPSEAERRGIETELEWCQRKAYSFMKTFKRDYKRFTNLYKYIINIEQERERRNIEELDELKRVYNSMQVEETEIKRKRWCRCCELEATYLGSMGINFYCSVECENKQISLSDTVEGSFKANVIPPI